MEFRVIPAKMTKDKKPGKKSDKPIDTFSGKRGRGRPYKIRAAEVTGRAYNYRIIFGRIWKSVGEQLVGAKTEAEILQVLERTAYKRDFPKQH